jgi:GAF domain-containing protein
MAPDLDPREFAELAKALHAAPTTDRTAEEVVSFAVQQMDADHAGIALLQRRGRLETIAATDPVVGEVDGLQSEFREGPCLEHGGEALLVADLESDRRWPLWGPKAAALGIASLLAVAFTTSDGRPAGSITLYWRRHRRFQPDDVAFATIFARHAAVALSSSLEIAGLSLALDGRKLIGQAQGILMERYGLDDARAFELLRRYSQDHNVKLRQIAEDLVSTRKLPTSPRVGS